MGSGTMLGVRLGRVASVVGLNESRVEISGEEASVKAERVEEEKEVRPLEKETVALGPMEREARDWLVAKRVVEKCGGNS